MQIKELYNKVPQLVKSFLLRAFLIFVVWQMLYRLVLFPIRVPDQFLTNTTAYATSKVVALYRHNVGVSFTHKIYDRRSFILINNKRVIGIADPCNALDIYVLYIAFLFCFPGTWKRRLAFIAIGIPYIFLLNIVRCALIAWLNLTHVDLVEISHHYIFTTAVYLAVFYLWVLYTKNGIVNER